jgi:hypothetical protein
MAIAAESLRVTPESVARCAQITADLLNRSYLAKGSSQPVVLTGLTQDWPALTTWSFDFFDLRYGQESVLVTDHLGSKNIQKVQLSAYLDYVRNPSGAFLAGKRSDAPWYSPYWCPFADHPELLADFDLSEAVENWMPAPEAVAARPGSSEEIMARWALRGFMWLFIGPSGTFTPRHLDTLNTHAWNCQITGRKRFDIWRPRAPDDGTPADLSVVLEPGETLIIPTGWGHSVTALEPSISLTGNFFNATNAADFFRAIYAQPDTWSAKGRLVPELKAAIRQ